MKLDTTDDAGVYIHWCPGCGMAHIAVTDQATTWTGIPTDRWSFDGNMEAPTFAPSFNIDLGNGQRCHYNINAGFMTFHADSTHKLAGSVVILPDFPEDY